MPTYQQLTRHVHSVLDLSWIGDLLGWVALMVLVLGTFVALRHLWRHRWHSPARPVSTDAQPLPDHELAEALGRDVGDQLAMVERGGPRDAIVACWAHLEEAVTAYGVPARVSETSSELVTRVLHGLDVDPRAVADLAELYREARFSQHPMGEEHRLGARTALRALRADLVRTGPRTRTGAGR